MTSIRWYFLIFLGLLLCTSLHAEEFLFRDRPVYILAGLPGDIETEKTYEDQTRRLLTLLNRPEMAPCGIQLFSSFTDFDFKSAVPLGIFPGKREDFLGITGQGKTKPPVFVVFGHGGLQGKSPVFHVPGPRLTPDDFSKVAGAFPESTWLLFFPGSSVFAKALQGEKRLILATESDEKTFKQDPVSFGMFLDLLPGETELEALSRKLGKEVYRWYQERTIVRTEDPSLWVEIGSPRKLIDPESDGEKVADGDKKNPENLPVAVEGWAGIKPVDPRDYPQADAVILARRQSYVLGDNPRLEIEEESFVQILTKDGKGEGDFRISFSPPEEDLKFLACEVRRANGTIESLDSSNIRSAARNNEEGNEAPTKWKIFSLPHVEPGSVLHVHWQRQWKHFPLPEIFQEIPLADDLPLLDLKIEIRVPEKSAFHFKARNQKLAAPEIKKTGYGSIYSWQLKDIPALRQEPQQGRETTPVLMATTFPDWENFSGWYGRLIREADNPTPELEAKAKELTRDLKTDREKVAAVSEFVTGFRYVTVPLGVNSHRPHAAGSVFQNRYGDCKDKANLLNTMLRTLGYKSDLVLVPRFSQAYDELPGFAFNHAISRVKLGNETLWIDTTDDVCRFGFLPPGDPGRNVLVMDEKKPALIRLPEPASGENRLVIETDLSLISGREAPVKIQATGRGFADYQLRYSSQKKSTRAGLSPLLNENYLSSSGLLELRSQKATEVAEMDQDFVWKGEGNFLGLVSEVPQTSTRLMRLPAWLPEEWKSAVLPRSTPLFLNQGYPMEIQQRFQIHLPEDISLAKIPKPRSGHNNVLSWKLSWASSSSNEVTAELELILLKADMTMEETGDFQTACRDLIEALQDGFSFQTPNDTKKL